MANPESLDKIEDGATYRQTQIHGEGSDGLPEPIGMVDDAAKSADQTTHAGDRIITSTIDSYKSVKEDWNYSVIDLSAGDTIVYAAPAIIGNIYVDVVMSAHAVTVKDDTTSVFNILASSAAGYSLTAMKGTRLESTLVVSPNASSTGTIVVQWRKL